MWSLANPVLPITILTECPLYAALAKFKPSLVLRNATLFNEKLFTKRLA